MNRIINFIIWPAVSGLVFGIVLLQLPRLAEYIPGLDAYLPKETIQQITTNSFSYADAIAKAAPAVVSINSTAEVGRKIGEEIINPFLKRETFLSDQSSSLGSGVIISPDGYIITSFHIFELQDPELVRNSESPLPEIIVTLYDGRSVEAHIIAVEEQSDLALLKIDESNLAYITEAEEYTFDAGDIVLAIGNPRNIGQSVTLGIISALLKTDDSYVIQTDAAINPGNSGGALVDVNGKLVGINSTIVSESGGSEGISFSVPARKAFDLMNTYIDRGPGAYLGVKAQFVSQIFSRMMLDMDARGLWVERLSAKGPADTAGLKINDIILSLGDIEINTEQAAFNAIQTVNNMNPGETVVARVQRGDEIITLPIILGVGEAVMWLTENAPVWRNNLYQELDPEPFNNRNLLR